MVRSLFVLVLTALFFAACAGSPIAVAPTPVPICTKQEAALFLNQVHPLIMESIGAGLDTGITQAMQGEERPLQLEALQEVRRRAQALDVPPCAAAVKEQFVHSIDTQIAANRSFGQSSDSASKALVQQFIQDLAVFYENVTHLRRGEPLTLSTPTASVPVPTVDQAP